MSQIDKDGLRKDSAKTGRERNTKETVGRRDPQKMSVESDEAKEEIAVKCQTREGAYGHDLGTVKRLVWLSE